MSRYAEYFGIALLVLGIAFIVYGFLCTAAYSQEAESGPTPNPIDYTSVQGELQDWWDWCLRHPNVLLREAKRYKVIGEGGGFCGRNFQQKLKVVGALAGRPPFASMTRTATYRPFIRDGYIRGLWSDGWNYQTSDSTDIGQGSFDEQTWGVGE